tara:strand:- start:37 stop:252 length:216 start_codon:yes stop_codon:yes gene_type:complete
MRVDMKLNEWRLSKKLSYRDLAYKVGAKHATIARRWCLSEEHPQRLIPNPDYMKAIMLATDGAVNANDFYN